MRYFRAVTAVVTVAVLVFAPDAVSWATEVQALPENNHVTTESRPVNTDPHAEIPAEGDEGMGGLEPSIDVNSLPACSDAAVPSEGDLSLNADVTLEVEAIEDPAELKQMESEIMQKQEEQWQGEVAEANQPIPDCDKK